MSEKKVLLTYNSDTGMLTQEGNNGFSYCIGVQELDEHKSEGGVTASLVELKKAGFSADEIIKLRSGGII